jgi:CRP/FNR family transcriptional regulator
MSLLDGKTAPATVSAMEDSKIISVSGTDFHKYLMHNEKVLLQIINVLCTRLRQVWQTQSLSSSKAESRIRMGINQLAQRHGVRDAHGIIIDLKITHQELAEMVGTSRETVTRVIAHLREEGIIEVDQRRMTLIDPEALLRE